MISLYDLLSIRQRTGKGDQHPALCCVGLSTRCYAYHDIEASSIFNDGKAYPDVKEAPGVDIAADAIDVTLAAPIDVNAAAPTDVRAAAATEVNAAAATDVTFAAATEVTFAAATDVNAAAATEVKAAALTPSAYVPI